MSVEVIRRQKRSDELQQALDCWRAFVQAINGVEDEVLTEDDDDQVPSEQLQFAEKKGPKCSASRGNFRHYGTSAEAGDKAGQFAPKSFRGKGSSSIANDPKYKGKKCPDGRMARRGKARLVKGQERFKKNAPGCGRNDPTRKNKCSVAESSVKVPDADRDGMVSVEAFAKALDRKQREVEALQATVKKLKTQKRSRVSINDFIRLTNALALAEKGKAAEQPQKK